MTLAPSSGTSRWWSPTPPSAEPRNAPTRHGLRLGLAFAAGAYLGAAWACRTIDTVTGHIKA